jgi:outer membrane beta-barrel protein
MAEKPMLKLNMLVGAQANITPFFGKMALFSKLFFNYDFYGFVGFGAALYADKCGGSDCIYNDSSGAAINYKNPTEGFKPGLTFGAGFHFFFNNWIALNAEIRDTALPGVNLAGRDMNWDPQRAADGSLLPPKTDKSDKGWDHVLTVLLGCSFYLPTTVAVSK